MNRVGNPGIVAVSENLCDIEKSLEEVIEGEILNISEFYFLMMKNSSFHVSTFLQECCLVEGPGLLSSELVLESSWETCNYSLTVGQI